MKRTYMRFR